MTGAGYPPGEWTLTVDGEQERITVVVARQPEGHVVGTVSGETDGPLARLFTGLDLATTDRLVTATWAVVHDRADPWQERISGVLVAAEKGQTRVSLRRDPRSAVSRLLARRGPDPVTVTTATVSLALALQSYREFLAAWTDGAHHDVTLHVDGAPETHRMARATDGTVQVVPHGRWSEVALFLSDLQDEDIIDFFVEQLRDVADGKDDQARTGTNATDLAIRRDVCELRMSPLGTASVSLDTRELYDELLRLRAFVADRTGQEPEASGRFGQT